MENAKQKYKSVNLVFQNHKKEIFFPPIYDESKLVVDKNLKPIKIIAQNIKESSLSNKSQIVFDFYIQRSKANVYLILNGTKKDVFYLIPSGTYVFNFYLKPGDNILELFYIVNGHKSKSVFKKYKAN